MAKEKQTAISEILQLLMFKKGIRSSNLAKKTNTPQQTMQRIVTGVSPNPHFSTLRQIANYFNITVEQLKGKEQLPEEYLFFPLIECQKKHRPTKEIPLLKWEQLNSFNPQNVNIDTDEKIVITPDLNPKCFSLTMSDSSMYPYFPLNSILIIDPDKQYKDRSFVLIKIAAEELYIFRQILLDGPDRYLKPINPDMQNFKMRLLDKNDKIIGVLVESRNIYNNTLEN